MNATDRADDASGRTARSADGPAVYGAVGPVDDRAGANGPVRTAASPARRADPAAAERADAAEAAGSPGAARTAATVGIGPDLARRADAIVAERLRAAAAVESLPGPATGATAVEIAASLSAGSPHAERFTAEIAAAVRGTALALEAARPHPTDLWAAAGAAHPDPSVWFEQAVLLGHPTHPLARSRGELTDDEIRSYAPEHRARFALGEYAFDTVRRNGADLRRHRPAEGSEAPGVPVHPWQARRCGLDAPVRVHAGAAPLMSLRTVSLGDTHLKTAVDLQLTSAVRHVSPASMHNGPRIAQLLAPEARRCGITLVPEAAVSAVTADGERDRRLAAIVRPAPHTLGHPRAVPIAALAEPCPSDGRPIAVALTGNDPEAWWAEFARVALAPLRLFAATGVALEAHGQNTLASFTGDRPVSLVYRDFGGVRVPAQDRWAEVRGDLVQADPEARLTKLLAALFPTTLTAIVAALAAWSDTDPGKWWSTVAGAIRDLDLDPWIADAVLRRPWPIKATTAMRLAAKPTQDIWARVENPVAAA
ncbi:IucA/IucC family protein [Glycomyces tritici]|uniref:IucA/IucC family protein n=1 Tax=Glycomyces tritici TaxID=2665176 RepID=A0ABT7YXZ2_9ACTN|nr:IucA/IucC family protein [Glycomyces tritici]MDN3243516.1 IucA/IucC family protein [Glycomyces tritici]